MLYRALLSCNLGGSCYEVVQKRFCKTPIDVTVYGEGVTEDGAPETVLEGSFMCNWQDGAEVIMTAEQKRVAISGRALFPGDICPDLPVISSGKVNVFGVERTIVHGRKSRNPDGTVNFTELKIE